MFWNVSERTKRAVNEGTLYQFVPPEDETGQVFHSRAHILPHTYWVALIHSSFGLPKACVTL